MKQSPYKVAIFIKLFNIGPVGVDVTRKHCLSIDIQHLESWITVEVCGDTANDWGPHDRLHHVTHTVVNLEGLLVSVTCQSEPNYVLEAFNERPIANTKLVLLIGGSVMHDYDGKSTISFNL